MNAALRTSSSCPSFGKYELFARLGSGGMAEVFLAVARGMAGFSKLVVLKRLRSAVAEEQGMVTMFLDEARLAARLHHSNIVNTYEVGEHEGSYYIAMEYLEGQPLNLILRHPECRTAFTHTMWCQVFAQALAGLGHAHEQRDFDGTALNIVHRDISPHNLFLTYGGELKVVDFGIAKAASNTSTTSTGILKGKINYMSPEQVRGSADHRSDLFSIGLSLWEAIAGRPVFRGEPVSVLQRLLHEPVPRLSSGCLDVEPELERIVMKGLERERSERYQSAEEFRRALEAYAPIGGPAVVDITDVSLGTKLSDMFRDSKENVAQRIRNSVPREPVAAARPEGSDQEGARAAPTIAAKDGVEASIEGHSSDQSPEDRMPTAAPAALEQVAERVVPLRGRNEGAKDSLRMRRNWQFALASVSMAILLVGGRAYVGGGHLAAAVEQPSAPSTSDKSAPIVESSGRAIDGIPRETPPSTERSRVAPASAPSAAKTAPRTLVVPNRANSAAVAPKATPPSEVSSAGTVASAGEKGSLSFATFPWTRVSEGGRVLGTTPLYNIPMSAGQHALTLENSEEGIRTTYRVVIKSGESTTRNVELKGM
jgi:eukaryotic-like serine/threonine-protein kinase